MAAYIAIQSFAVSAPYFLMDDAQELVHVRGMGSWLQLFGADGFHLFRPVKNILFAFFSLFPEDMTWVCRVTGITIGCISLFPVVSFFRRVFGDERRTLLAAATWMLAPTLVSSVAWLSCVNIQVMCAFGALAIVFHDKAFGEDRSRCLYVAWAAVCIFLACVSYEQAVAVGPIVILFDFYLNPARIRSKRTFPAYVVYAVVSIFYLILRGMVGSVSALNGSFDHVSRLDIALASAYFTCQHFFVWIWPFGNMSPAGSYSAGNVSLFVLVGCWLTVLALVSFSLVMRRRIPLVAMGIAISLMGFLPVSNVLGFGNGPYGDYYMGLPSMGLSIMFVAIVELICASGGRLGLVRFTFVVLLLASRIFAIPEAARWAWLWADGARSFASGIEAFPSAFSNRQFYARVCYESGRIDDAIKCCEWLESHLHPESEQLTIVFQIKALIALNVARDPKVAMSNLAAALRVDKKGVSRRVTKYYRGCVFEDLLGDEKSAESEYREAISGKWNADTPAAADRLARLLAIRGELDVAETLWAKGARCRPDDDSIRHNLLQLRRVKAEGKEL